jgi:hypothetical protein
MTITILTIADVAPTDAEVELVASTDTNDQWFTWAAVPPTGVTFTQNPSPRISGQNTSITGIRVSGAAAAQSIAITCTGDVSPTSQPHEIEFVPYSDATHPPMLLWDSNEAVVEPGDVNDYRHSPLYRLTLQRWDTSQIPPKYVSVAGAEVRWTASPPVIANVYQGATMVSPITTNNTYFPIKTDANGYAEVRVTTGQIVQLTVQADTLGVSMVMTQRGFYSTLDPNSPYYQQVPVLGPGPYTDNPVNLDLGTEFGVTIPASLTPPPGGFGPPPSGYHNGWLHLEGNGTYIPATWRDMASALGTVASVPDIDAARDNTLGLFVQDRSGDVATYDPWPFTTTGGHVGQIVQPDPSVSRQPNWIPNVTGLQSGGVINQAYLNNNNGIPLTVTYDFGAPYNDGSWFIYFEWFLNNYDTTRTGIEVSPQLAGLQMLKIKPGSQTYTDTLSISKASGYQGPGEFYCDFFLGKPDHPIPIPAHPRVYSNWNRVGYTLST